jgi:hypothetical protein
MILTDYSAKRLFTFVLFVYFSTRLIILFLFFVPGFGAGRLFICLIAGTIVSQVAKNEKPTVGI